MLPAAARKKRFTQVFPKAGTRSGRSGRIPSPSSSMPSSPSTAITSTPSSVRSTSSPRSSRCTSEPSGGRSNGWRSRQHIVVIKVGTANAYVLDPTDLWKNLDQYKGYCAFTSKTLAKKDASLKRRLTHMIEGQGELFRPENEGGGKGSGGGKKLTARGGI